MSTVARVPAPMVEGHRAQGEVGALLPIETLGGYGPLILGQCEPVKARLRVTLEGHAVSKQHQGGWLG